jgi:Putative peptidoglycan binding domain
MYRPILRFGSTGPAVTLLQKALNQAASMLPQLVADGIFGTKTHGRVLEFQRQSNLSADGAVGNDTHAQLEFYYKIVEKLIDFIPPPGSIEAARDRIVGLAESHLNFWGWSQNPSGEFEPDPASPRIAGREWSESTAKWRQGGFSLATIFQVSGTDSTRCPILSQPAWEMYHGLGDWAIKDAKGKVIDSRKYTPDERNTIDIPSWCGIFATYIFRASGLKVQDWKRRLSFEKPAPPPPANVAPPPSVPTDFFLVDGPNVTDLLERGDVGIASPSGRVHHFLITDVSKGQLKTIDGNDGSQQTIIRRNYAVLGRDGAYTYKISDGNHGLEFGFFLKPNWSEILKP